MKKRELLAMLAAVPAASAATFALAQFGKKGDRARKDGAGKGEPPRANTLEVTLSEFEEDLKLTPPQQPAWRAYADALSALAADAERVRRAPRTTDADLLRRLDRAVDVQRDRLTAVEDVAQSAKALYKGLAAEQQQRADPRLVNLIALSIDSLGAGCGSQERRPPER